MKTTRPTLPPRRLPRLALAALLALAPLAAARAAPALYRYDPVHSQILFSIDHNGFSRPFGRLHIARGWLRFDPDDWSASATELDVDLAGLDMGDADWNAALRKHAFFDTDRARYAHFASTSVERKDPTHGLLHGNLSFRGVTKPVTLAFTANRRGTTVFGLHEVAGFSATATLARADFGITAFPNAIGQNASLWLELEAIRDDHAQDAAPSPGADHP
jgi:polyisoprenoid-binding protein YceI